MSGATSEDFAEDAIAGVEYLKTRFDIDADQVGLIGHSEGAIIAAIVASQSEDIAFIVMMAGYGITGEEILYLQSEFLLREAGAGEAVIDRDHDLRARIFQIVKEESDVPLETRLTDVRSELIRTVVSAGTGAQAAEVQVGAMLQAYSDP
jgi:dienelactone hydrolase